jgi:hypothetical protein
VVEIQRIERQDSIEIYISRPKLNVASYSESRMLGPPAMGAGAYSDCDAVRYISSNSHNAKFATTCFLTYS